MCEVPLQRDSRRVDDHDGVALFAIGPLSSQHGTRQTVKARLESPGQILTWPDSGLDFQVKVLFILKLSPLRSEAEGGADLAALESEVGPKVNFKEDLNLGFLIVPQKWPICGTHLRKTVMQWACSGENLFAKL